MSNRKLICAVGCQNSGKDYLMNRLQNRLIYTHGYYQRTVRCRFADALNVTVASILGINDSELQDRSLKEIKRFVFGTNLSGVEHEWSSRDVQKKVGQLLRENLGEDVFINALDKRYTNPKNVLLISDLRYQNELDWVREQGGKVLYIHNEKAAQAQKARESVTWDCGEIVHYPPESEELQWDFYHKSEKPDYWLDNNDFDNHSHFDDFVKFVVGYLEEK